MKADVIYRMAGGGGDGDGGDSLPGQPWPGPPVPPSPDGGPKVCA
ncbi:hypothetical protein ACWCQQ_09705 [Streptomyces sp. NPDC002143]